MRNAFLLFSTSALVYGIYSGLKYKQTDIPMPEKEKIISGIALVIGLGGLGLGYFKSKSK